MEQLEKEYVTEARQKWKEITEMMPFEPEEVKLATFEGILRPFIYWSESRQGRKNAAPVGTPWYAKYKQLKLSADKRYIAIVEDIPDELWPDVAKSAKDNNCVYDRENRGFLVKEGATA